MSEKNGRIESWRDFLVLLRKDPDLFHEMVTNPGEALSKLEGVSDFLKDKIAKVYPGDLVSITVTYGGPSEWCGVTCGGGIASCAGTCGSVSCEDTCTVSCWTTCESSCIGSTCLSSCEGTCGQPSCGDTCENPGDIVSNPGDMLGQPALRRFRSWKMR